MPIIVMPHYLQPGNYMGIIGRFGIKFRPVRQERNRACKATKKASESHLETLALTVTLVVCEIFLFVY